MKKKLDKHTLKFCEQDNVGLEAIGEYEVYNIGD